MSKVKEALCKVERMELGALAAGDSKNRLERSLSLVAAHKVMDHLGAAWKKGWVHDENDSETGERLVVNVPTSRIATAVVPEGLGGADIPERTLSLSEVKTRIYKPYPFGMRGIFPLATTQRVTLRELTPGADADKVTVTGSNKIGFYESDNSLEELVSFSRNLELIARGAGFYPELTMANEGLFLPSDYASLRNH